MGNDNAALPLAGLRVVEFTHMVMGASVGLILGDLGAEVIKVEPPGGDPTRWLLGSGAGYFPMFNRNKRSLCLDLKQTQGLAVARSLAARADILVENFRPGTLTRLGLGYDDLTKVNPRLIYCSAKGFLTGPYENRTALDEVVQMMGGLAYMTGPPGRPLRAGSSVVDITGGMFGVIAVLAALERRHRTGRGGEIKCALFETTAFLVGQHMAQQAVTGEAAQPMPVRLSAWAIYDVFETARKDELLFVGVVSDSQWVAFARAFALHDLEANADLRSNNQRVLARGRILPRINALFREMLRADIVAKLEAAGLPFAPIARPEELFDDPHLVDSEGLVELQMPNGETTRLPRLPLEFDGVRPPLQRGIPGINADGAAILRELGLDDAAVSALRESGATA